MILTALAIIITTVFLAVAIGWFSYHSKSPSLIPAWTQWLFFSLILAGCFLIFLQFSRLEKALAQKNWPTTTGFIIKSEVTKTRDAWPVITYVYELDGEKFTRESNMNFPGFGGRTNRLDAANKLVAQYAAGKKITVYYDPVDPGHALLKPGPTWDIFGQSGLGMTLLFLGIFFLFRNFISKKFTQKNSTNTLTIHKRNANGKPRGKRAQQTH